MPHVFPAKYLDLVPPNAEIDLPTNPLPPTGVAATMVSHRSSGGVVTTPVSQRADSAFRLSTWLQTILLYSQSDVGHTHKLFGWSQDWNSGKGANGPVAREDMLTPADDYTVRDWKQNYYAAAAFSDDLFGQLLVSLGAAPLHLLLLCHLDALVQVSTDELIY